MNKDDLVSFATEMAEEFNAGKIPHPIHLSDGNEDQLIGIFEEIEENDWVCGGWRMHSQCLLKGVPEEEVKEAIRAGRSMTLCFSAYKVISSAIAGGILPIAVGLALANRMEGNEDVVHCFLGDMTMESGIFHECYKFSEFHNLRLHWIVEDNEISVCTPTKKVWGDCEDYDGITKYQYKSKYPHAGAGIRVQF